MSGLNELERVLKPPSGAMRPVVDWRLVEEAIGTALPTDYRRFAGIYGPGKVDDLLWVYYPSIPSTALRLEHRIRDDLEGLRCLRARGSEHIPYPLFPEPGGLISWGGTDYGDVCYWRTHASNPEDWTVVVNEGRAPEWAEYPGSMTDFLAAVLTKRYVCPIFPKDFPSDSPTFEAHCEPAP